MSSAPDKHNLPSINLKGKEYVLVSERVKFFNDNYLNGQIRTEMVAAFENGLFAVKATVWPDYEANANLYFNGHSAAKLGGSGANQNAALENAETSAIGRALGAMGIGVIDAIASADEMYKAFNDGPRDIYEATGDNRGRVSDRQQAPRRNAPPPRSSSQRGNGSNSHNPASDRQKGMIYAIWKGFGWEQKDAMNWMEDLVGEGDTRQMTSTQASTVITALKEIEEGGGEGVERNASWRDEVPF